MRDSHGKKEEVKSNEEAPDTSNTMEEEVVAVANESNGGPSAVDK